MDQHTTLEQRGLGVESRVQTLGVIGYGGFGHFLHVMVSAHAPDISVKISSTSHAPDGSLFFPFEEVCACDIVVLAVPTHSFEEVLEKVIPNLGPESIVFDVATVKNLTANILSNYRGKIQYMATHPMFGPYSYEKRGGHLEGLRIAICDHSLKEGMYARICSWLNSMGLVILELTPDEHDKMLAETLFLTHFVAQTIVKGGFKRTEIDTVSFGFMMDAVESVKHDKELFLDVYRYNPYCKEVLDRLLSSCKEVKEELEEAAKFIH